MKKITLSVLFALISFSVFSQEPYSNYWDATSEWRYVSGGWDGFHGFTYYTTTYFDGYEVIDGISYWKEYTYRREVTTAWDGTPIDETILFPDYILTREDEAGNFYRRRIEWDYEVLSFRNQPIIDVQIGQTYPTQGAACNVESIETNYLGSRPLKRIKGPITGNNAGTLEGVGAVGNNCAMGIEYNGGINCYKKQNNILQFGTIDCDSPLFPPALRTSLGIGNQPQAKKFGIFPNPSKGTFKINLPSGVENARYKIYNLNGLKVNEGTVASSEESIIDITTLSSGIYVVKVSNGTISDNLKVVKQ